MNWDKANKFIFEQGGEYLVVLPHLKEYQRVTQIMTPDDLGVIEESDIVELKRLGDGTYRVTYLTSILPVKRFKFHAPAAAFVRKHWYLLNPKVEIEAPF